MHDLTDFYLDFAEFNNCHILSHKLILHPEPTMRDFTHMFLIIYRSRTN